MSRNAFAHLSLAALVAALATGCGGSSSVGGPDEGPAPAGQAVVQGTVTGSGAGSGLRVGVVGTPIAADVDEDGQFAVAGLPAGTVTLRFEGSGIDARLSVAGLLDGQVTSITVHLSGGDAQLSGTPTCAPTAETAVTGTLERVSGNSLVVAGRPVDVSRLQKVWRGDRRIELSDLEVGEKVKVWGTLRGDGVVMADEIMALTRGGETGDSWVSFRGKVESVAASSLDVSGRPYAGSYPTLVVKGTTVRTDSSTKVKRADGSSMSAGEIRVGDTATVEGWKKSDGSVKAAKILVEGTGSAGGDSWVSFRGRVDSVSSSSRDVHGNPYASSPTFVIGGRTVKTDGSTRFKWSDATALDPKAVRAGDQAYVEGWSKPEGYVLAAKLVVDCRQ